MKINKYLKTFVANKYKRKVLILTMIAKILKDNKNEQ